jgi:hypothetical protein
MKVFFPGTIGSIIIAKLINKWTISMSQIKKKSYQKKKRFLEFWLVKNVG